VVEAGAGEVFRVLVPPGRQVDGKVEVVGDAELELVTEVEALVIRLVFLVGAVCHPLLVLPLPLAHRVGVGVERERPGVRPGDRGGGEQGGHGERDADEPGRPTHKCLLLLRLHLTETESQQHKEERLPVK
jgi:hypothetical protein